MNLRLAGGSFAQIAAVLCVSKQQAFRDVRASLTETLMLRDGDAERYRELELMRLDSMQTAMWPAVQKGDVESIRAALRVSQRRAALLGLDATVRNRLEVTGVVYNTHHNDLSQLSDDELLARLDRARAALTADRTPVALPSTANIHHRASEPPLTDSLERQKSLYQQALAERASGNGGS